MGLFTYPGKRRIPGKRSDVADTQFWNRILRNARLGIGCHKRDPINGPVKGTDSSEERWLSPWGNGIIGFTEGGNTGHCSCTILHNPSSIFVCHIDIDITHFFKFLSC